MRLEKPKVIHIYLFIYFFINKIQKYLQQLSNFLVNVCQTTLGCQFSGLALQIKQSQTMCIVNLRMDGPANMNQGMWSAEQERRFLLGIQKHGNKWKQVQKIVKTRTNIQCSNHARVIFKNSSKIQLKQHFLGQILDDSDSSSEYYVESSSVNSEYIALEQQKNPQKNLLVIFAEAIYHQGALSFKELEQMKANMRKKEKPHN